MRFKTLILRTWVHQAPDKIKSFDFQKMRVKSGNRGPIIWLELISNELSFYKIDHRFFHTEEKNKVWRYLCEGSRQMPVNDNRDTSNTWLASQRQVVIAFKWLLALLTLQNIKFHNVIMLLKFTSNTSTPLTSLRIIYGSSFVPSCYFDIKAVQPAKTILFKTFDVTVSVCLVVPLHLCHLLSAAAQTPAACLQCLWEKNW